MYVYSPPAFAPKIRVSVSNSILAETLFYLASRWYTMVRHKHHEEWPKDSILPGKIKTRNLLFSCPHPPFHSRKIQNQKKRNKKILTN